MESKFYRYELDASDERIKEILDSSETFEEVDSIPSRSSLTFNNGFYVNCTAVFIDIRGSSKLTENHTRPVLGKIYRSYIAECVAIMNDNNSCKEVFISGDCVNGIFDSPYQSQIVSAFETAGKLSSCIELLNYRLSKKGYQPIKCGIGIAYGRALMIKAGAKGSGVNDVVWMGDVVNEAAHLCHQGNRGSRKPVQISKLVQHNLTDEYKGFCNSVGFGTLFDSENYETEIYNVQMRKYLDDEKARYGDTANFLSSLFQNKSYPTNYELAEGLLRIPPKRNN